MKGAFELEGEQPAKRPPRTSAEAAPVKPMTTDAALMSAVRGLQTASAKPPGVEVKPSFTPGPQPAKYGTTLPELKKDPEKLSAIAERVAAWEAENPGKVLTGPKLLEAVGDAVPMSPAQGTRLASWIKAEQKKMLAPKSSDGRAAAAVLTKKA